MAGKRRIEYSPFSLYFLRIFVSSVKIFGMKRLAFVICTFVCLQSSYGGTYVFSTTAGTIGELTIPWTRQGDTLRFTVTIKNTSAGAHSVKLSLNQLPGNLSKNGSPLFFDVGGQLRDSIRLELGAGASQEFTIVDVPARYAAGRHKRYINVFEDYSFQAIESLPIEVSSALTLRKRAFVEEVIVELRDLTPGVTEYFPVYFHNDSAGTQVVTEFISTTLPPWITTQNKYSYPLVIVPNEVVNFGNIVVTAPAPNLEKLEGPVYAIYQSGSDSNRTAIRLYITSVADTALLKTCIEFSLDAPFMPLEVGQTTTQNLRIRSNRHHTLRVSQPQLSWGDVEGFSFSTSMFPVELPAFSEVSLPVTFAPTTVVPFVKYRYAATFTAHAESDSTSCDPSITLAGVVNLGGAVEPVAGGEVHVRISANPMSGHGTISVDGLANATIEISDMLGHSRAKQRAAEMEVSGLPAGSYIVRVSGIYASGWPAVVSRLLIIQ